MWALALKPRNPFTNLAISVLVGSTIATLLYTFYMFLNMEELEFTLKHVIFGGLATLILAPVYTGLVVLIFVSPLLWCAIRLGYAGPLVVIPVGCLPILLWHDIGVVLYPVAILVVYVLLAYPSLMKSGLKNYDA